VDLVLSAGPDAVSYQCGLDADRDAFLGDHRLDGVPVLPAVVALELLAEAASLAGLGERPRLEDVTVEAALKVPQGGHRTVTLEAVRDVEGRAWDVRLQADVVGRGGRVMETGRTFVQGRARAADALAVPGNGNGVHAEARVVPARYGPVPGGGRRRVVHGAAFQTLREVIVSDGDVHAAKIVATSARSLRPWRPDGRWTFPGPALDGCLQACGVLARLLLDALALPSRFGRIQAGRSPRDGEECRACIRLRGREGDLVRFDFTLVGDDGAPLVRVDDYAARVFAGIGTPATVRPEAAARDERA
jgi:hypothetical protein